ncbi:MAG: hypothetical protein ACKVP2_02455 [Burkholderiales bacterium]
MCFGGVTGWTRSSAIAGAAGMPLSSHLYPEVSAQLLRVSESTDWLERGDRAQPVLAVPFLAKDGFAHRSNTPGNELAWDEAATEKFAI